ncbi:MAG: hypothetical protein H6695_11765 [Deferribacteres bacterium]|nr:hypothetical protein [candidate division KSB1 bacterium]MCB9510856.1 hypothetical protein [Deferribacteres bacterium]
MQKNNIDVQALLHLVKRRKWFIIIPLILASIGGYIRIITLVSEYKSTATVVINKNYVLTNNMGDVLPGVEARDKIKMRDHKETFMKQLLSTNLLKKVVERAGFEPSNSQKERAKKLVAAQPSLSLEEAARTIQAASLRSDIEVIFPNRGTYIEVSTTSRDPQEAYLVTKYLVELFIEDVMLEEQENVQGTLRFSEEQMKIFKQEADQAEERLRNFRQSVAAANDNVVPISPANIEQVQSLVSTNSVELSKKIKESSELDQQLGRYGSEVHIQQTQRFAEIKASLIEKLTDLAKLMISLNWNSGDILRLKSEIADLREAMANEVEKYGARHLRGLVPGNIVDLAVQKEIVKAEITFLQAQQKTLSRLRRSYSSNNNTMPAYEVTAQKLQADFDKYLEMYQIFADQVRSAQITGAMQEVNRQIRYRVIDPAQLPTKPVNASTNQVILVSLIMGLGVGAGFIYLLEFIDQSFKSVDEVENYLGLVVLGTVPKVEFVDKAQTAKKNNFSF